MAKLTYGLLGPVEGKLGKKVYYTLSGVQHVRLQPGVYTKDPTPEQMAVRMKFSYLSNLLLGLGGLLNEGYKPARKLRMSVKNWAFKVNYPHVSGVSPDFRFYYPDLVLTYPGREVLAKIHAKLELLADGRIRLDWTQMDFEVFRWQDPSDRLKVLCYNVSQNKFMQPKGTVRRGDLFLNFNFLGARSGDEIHCWGFFVSDDETVVSFTNYFGKVIMG